MSQITYTLSIISAKGTRSETLVSLKLDTITP